MKCILQWIFIIFDNNQLEVVHPKCKPICLISKSCESSYNLIIPYLDKKYLNYYLMLLPRVKIKTNHIDWLFSILK
jgi:hypothetical protein